MQERHDTTDDADTCTELSHSHRSGRRLGARHAWQRQRPQRRQMIESSSTGETKGGGVISPGPPFSLDGSDPGGAASAVLVVGAVDAEFDSCNCFFGGGISATDGAGNVALLLVRADAS